MSIKVHDLLADVFREMRARSIATVCAVPDGGLTWLLKISGGGATDAPRHLSTEPEGIGIASCARPGTANAITRL